MAAPFNPNPHNRSALPAPESIAVGRKGWGRSAQIRRLYAARVSVGEIAEFLRIDAQEVRRTLRRPAQLEPKK